MYKEEEGKKKKGRTKEIGQDEGKRFGSRGERRKKTRNELRKERFSV